MLTAEQIARVVHEANRAVQIEQNDPTIPVSNSWDESSPSTRDSAIAGVVGAQSGFGPAESHNGWMEFKLNDGWVLGPMKNEELKQHPLLVPYEDLPESQKVKDKLFLAIVKVLSE